MTTTTALTTHLSDTVSTAATYAVSNAGYGPHHGDGPGWWVIFPITWLLIVAGIATFVIVTARRRSSQWGRRAGESKLAERYAAGEIDEQEYRARLATLRQVGDA